jgi:Kef-type K+ transport system membrane component KefB
MPDITKFRMILSKSGGCFCNPAVAFVFCFTGLHTQVGLINDAYLWKVTAGIIAVAVGKFVGSALAAKFVGQNCMIASTIGLMNTRGLMELIVLNIGLELKC